MFNNRRFILIPQSMNHSDVVSSFQLEDVHSAGFVQFYIKQYGNGDTEIEVDCYGESISLNKKSDGSNDEAIISRSLK